MNKLKILWSCLKISTTDLTFSEVNQRVQQQIKNFSEFNKKKITVLDIKFSEMNLITVTF